MRNMFTPSREPWLAVISSGWSPISRFLPRLTNSLRSTLSCKLSDEVIYDLIDPHRCSVARGILESVITELTAQGCREQCVFGEMRAGVAASFRPGGKE